MAPQLIECADDLAAAVEHVRVANYHAATLIVPRPLAAGEVSGWRGEPRIRRVIAASPLPDVDDQRLRRMPENGLSGAVAQADGVPVVVAAWQMLRLPAFVALLRRGKFSLVCRRGPAYERVTVGAALMWMVADCVLWLSAARGGTLAQRLYRRLAAHGRLRRLWRRLFRRSHDWALPEPRRAGAQGPVPDHAIAPFVELLARVGAAPCAAAVSGRVLLVNDGLGPGGAERQLVIAAKALQAAGVRDLTVLGLHTRQDTALEFFLPDLTAAQIPFAAVRHPVSLLTVPDGIMPLTVAAAAAELPHSLLQLVHTLAAEFARRRPAVVHSWQDATNVAAGLAALAAGVPRVVLSTRSLSPDHFPFLTPYMRPAYRAMLGSRRVAILNNSRAGAASYAEWLGVGADRIEVVRNSLAVPETSAAGAAFRRTAGIPPGAPIIGSVFRLSEEKQPLLWLDAVLAALMQRQDAHAVMIGDGPMGGEFLGRLKGAPCAARFRHFPAWRPATDAIAAFDVFFLTSRVEGLPNVVLEAQAAGVPVVATEVGGVAEAVLPGRTAILVAPQHANAERLREALLAVLDDNALRARTRKEAPQFVARSFAPKAMAEKLIELYGMPPGCSFGR